MKTQPATRATTAEEFHEQFEAAMSSKGPHLIEAQVAVTIQPVVDQILKGRKQAEDHTK
jgi:thiamine pyrophosphate-dependent acetolactate synthase large subunit-like protein